MARGRPEPRSTGIKHGIAPAYHRTVDRALLSGEILDGATITLDAAGDELTVRWQNPGAAEPVEPESADAVA